VLLLRWLVNVSIVLRVIPDASELELPRAFERVRSALLFLLCAGRNGRAELTVRCAVEVVVRVALIALHSGGRSSSGGWRSGSVVCGG
jgi:hypothetical protein